MRASSWISFCAAAMLSLCAWQAQATCITHPDGSWSCCPPGGPCSSGPGPSLGNWDLRLHTSIGFGHAWVENQLAEVAQPSYVGGRILMGVEYGLLGVDLAIFGSDLEATLGAHSTFTFAGVLNTILPVWRATSPDNGSLSIVPHVGYGWTVVVGDTLDSHAGPSLSVGAQLRYDMPLEDLQDPSVAFRVFLDGNYEWIWLQSDDLQRHINAEMFQFTGGVGVVFGGL